MKCEICSEEIYDLKSIKLFEGDICRLCMCSMAEIPVNHILYDFYKDKIRSVLMKKLHEVL